MTRQQPTCRSCGAPLSTVFADLGLSPISNAFPRADTIATGEHVWPLKAMACDRCLLVQIEDIVGRDTHFNDDYAYFSSVSSSWLDHAKRYVDMAVDRFSLTAASHVVEVASNDGYLLRHFVARGIPSLGVDPAGNCAVAAKAWGVKTEVGFFGADMARHLAATYGKADLMVANNVLAHVPDLDDFVAGFAALLKTEGTITFEFPHLMQLVNGAQFDTIYHEHYSYLTEIALAPLFDRHGLVAYDVERIQTHGGSLRLFVGHKATGQRETPALRQLIDEERRAGLDDIATYWAFMASVQATKRAILSCLIPLKNAGATICGYGAPAKATTLLNYCGIGADFLDFTVDRSPEKQGRRIPGTGIEILPPEAISKYRPDYILILPWNLKDEIISQLAYVREWGCRFIVPIPEPTILD